MPGIYLSLLLGLICCCTISQTKASPAPVPLVLEQHASEVSEPTLHRVKRYGYGGGWGGGYPGGGFGYPGGGFGYPGRGGFGYPGGGGFGYPGGGGFGYPGGGFGSGFGSSFGLNARFSLNGFNNAFLGGFGK